jgi:hypothetical protein
MFGSASAQVDTPITIDIYESQYIPIDDDTTYLAVLVNYTTNDPSYIGSTINGVMHTFAPDGDQLKTSSYPNGFEITESGTILFGTHFDDQSFPSLTVNITLTDLGKTFTTSNTDSVTVPFDDEEGQEPLGDRFLREAQFAYEKQQSEINDREIQRIESSSQSGLEISSATTYFGDEYFHIVGEVHNTDSTEKEFVKVTATIYDENNNVIGTDTTFTSPSSIPSQESAPFEFMIGQSDVSDLDDITSYKIIASDQ